MSDVTKIEVKARKRASFVDHDSNIIFIDPKFKKFQTARVTLEDARNMFKQGLIQPYEDPEGLPEVRPSIARELGLLNDGAGENGGAVLDKEPAGTPKPIAPIEPKSEYTIKHNGGGRYIVLDASGQKAAGPVEGKQAAQALADKLNAGETLGGEDDGKADADGATGAAGDADAGDQGGAASGQDGGDGNPDEQGPAF